MAEKKPVSKAKSKKIIDVAHPEDAQPEIGSKPMIVGHSSMAKDTTLKDSAASGIDVTDAPDEDSKPIERKPKKKIQPLSNQEKADADTPPDAKAESVSQDKDAQAQANATQEEAQPTSKDAAVDAGTDSKEELEPAALELEREESLRKLVESKKYRVSIKETSSMSTGKAIGFIVAAIVTGLAGLFLLVDSGTLDLGVELPFSVFGSKESEVVESTITTPVVVGQPESDLEAERVEEVDPAPATPPFPGETLVTTDPNAEEGFKFYDNKTFGVSFDYPDSWDRYAISDTDELNGFDSTYLRSPDFVAARDGVEKGAWIIFLALKTGGDSETVDSYIARLTDDTDQSSDLLADEGSAEKVLINDIEMVKYTSDIPVPGVRYDWFRDERAFSVFYATSEFPTAAGYEEQEHYRALQEILGFVDVNDPSGDVGPSLVE